MKRENLIVALCLLSLSAVAAVQAESPRAKALREDFRKVPGVTSVDRIDRSVAVGSPRSQANQIVVVSGVSVDRIDRGPSLGSPRALAVFPFLKGSGSESGRDTSLAAAPKR
jgi:hypothetical protein